MTTKETDIKKQLEAIVGHELSDDALQSISFVQSVATATTLGGMIVRKNLLVVAPNQCSRIPQILDVAGFWLTGPDGKSEFKLTNFLCPAGAIFMQPINLVATPLSSKPCFLTAGHSLLGNGADVEIKILTWDASGDPAPNVSFNWRCRVAFRAP